MQLKRERFLPRGDHEGGEVQRRTAWLSVCRWTDFFRYSDANERYTFTTLMHATRLHPLREAAALRKRTNKWTPLLVITMRESERKRSLAPFAIHGLHHKFLLQRSKSRHLITDITPGFSTVWILGSWNQHPIEMTVFKLYVTMNILTEPYLIQLLCK